MFLLFASGLLTIHLMAVSIGAIGPLCCLYFEWREKRRQDVYAGQFGRLLARRSIECLLLGAAIGLLQLVLLWWYSDQRYLEALKSIEPSRWWFAGLELLFSLGCLTIYWYTWGRWRRTWLHAALAFVSSTNIAYHFPTLFVIVGVIRQRPALMSHTVAVRSMLLDPEVMLRVTHFLFAALAVASVFIMLSASRSKSDAYQTQRHGYIVFGARLGLFATVVQLPLGLLLLAQMTDPLRQQLLGTDWVATTTFFLAVLLTLALAHELAVVSMGEVPRSMTWRSASLVMAILFCMIVTRHRTGDTPTSRRSELRAPQVTLRLPK